MRQTFRATIPFDNLIYGELINFINNEGLALCMDLELKTKIKDEFQKQELGSFLPNIVMKKYKLLRYEKAPRYTENNSYENLIGSMDIIRTTRTNKIIHPHQREKRKKKKQEY